MRWQIDPNSMPLFPPGSSAEGRGFGLLLAGGPTIGDLTADDSTNCMSDVWNITIQVTYTVPPDGGPFRDPR
jgi:hypothetical protein